MTKNFRLLAFVSLSVFLGKPFSQETTDTADISRSDSLLRTQQLASEAVQETDLSVSWIQQVREEIVELREHVSDGNDEHELLRYLLFTLEAREARSIDESAVTRVTTEELQAALVNRERELQQMLEASGEAETTSPLIRRQSLR